MNIEIEDCKEVITSDGRRRRAVKFMAPGERIPGHYGYIYCPFCGDKVKVYWRSLAGTGKRCECGALLNSEYSAFKEQDTNV